MRTARNTLEIGATDAPGTLRMEILGPLRLWRGGVEVDAGARLQRCALVLLLARAGSPVSMSEMVGLMWGEVPPASAVNAVHKYVGTLRRLFEPELGTRSAGHWLLRNGSGYQFNVSSDVLDLSAFRAATAAARRSLIEGDEDTCLRRSVDALALWRGPAGDDLAETPAAQMIFAGLDREYLQLAVETGKLARKLDCPEAVLDQLWRATVVGPLHEPVHAELIANLALAGHHSEALSAYHAVRVRLADELGIDPSPPLRSAYRVIDTTEEPSVEAPRPVAAHEAPAQLPPRLPSFVGRADIQSEVIRMISSSRRAPVIVAFDGMPGVGKTALALHVAHTLLPAYPDGQLHLDLRGFTADARPLTPETALRDLLSGLGVAPRQIPESRQAMAGLYRTLLRGRRMLIVLDDARGVDQLVDLLPGSCGSITLITSRPRLTALRTSAGAHLVPVGLPARGEARVHLAAHFGGRMGDADPRAVDALLDHCDRLPLALAHAGVTAAACGDVRLADTVEVLRCTETSVSETFARSYRELGPLAARLFRRLASTLEPGADLTVEDVSMLLAQSWPAARSLLTELHNVGLLQASRPGCYQWHRLVRAYAANVARPNGFPS